MPEQKPSLADPAPTKARMSLLARALWIQTWLSVWYLVFMAATTLGAVGPVQRDLFAIIAGAVAAWLTLAPFRRASKSRLWLILVLWLTGAAVAAILPLLLMTEAKHAPLFALLALPLGGLVGIVIAMLMPSRRRH